MEVDLDFRLKNYMLVIPVSAIREQDILDMQTPTTPDRAADEPL